MSRLLWLLTIAVLVACSSPADNTSEQESPSSSRIRQLLDDDEPYSLEEEPLRLVEQSLGEGPLRAQCKIAAGEFRHTAVIMDETMKFVAVFDEFMGDHLKSREWEQIDPEDSGFKSLVAVLPEQVRAWRGQLEARLEREPTHRRTAMTGFIETFDEWTGGGSTPEEQAYMLLSSYEELSVMTVMAMAGMRKHGSNLAEACSSDRELTPQEQEEAERIAALDRDRGTPDYASLHKNATPFQTYLGSRAGIDEMFVARNWGRSSTKEPTTDEVHAAMNRILLEFQPFFEQIESDFDFSSPEGWQDETAQIALYDSTSQFHERAYSPPYDENYAYLFIKYFLHDFRESMDRDPWAAAAKYRSWAGSD